MKAIYMKVISLQGDWITELHGTLSKGQRLSKWGPPDWPKGGFSNLEKFLNNEVTLKDYCCKYITLQQIIYKHVESHALSRAERGCISEFLKTPCKRATSTNAV